MLVLAGRMAPPASTRISARLKLVLEHSSRVNLLSQVSAGVLEVFSARGVESPLSEASAR